jgi:photosystem II stability/assembly factor-like uncharacterized protein
LGESVSALVKNQADDLLAGAGPDVFRSTDNGVSWTRRSVGLPRANVLSLAIDCTGTIIAGTNGSGTYRSTDDGLSWSQIPGNLGNTPVTSIVTTASGGIFAGTDGGGVYWKKDVDREWQTISSGLPLSSIRSLALGTSEQVFAGTSMGFYRSVRPDSGWELVGVSPEIKSVMIGSAGQLFVLNSGGGFRSANGGLTWQVMDVPVASALALGRNGEVFAGTEGGAIYCSTDGGITWNQRGRKPADFRITTLAVNANGYIFATCTDETGFPYDLFIRSTDGGATWLTREASWVQGPAQTIIVDLVGQIFVGTWSKGIYRSGDNGDSWTQFLPGHGIDSFAENSSGDIFAGGSRGVFLSRDRGITWNYVMIPTLDLGDDVHALCVNAEGHIFAGTSRALFRSGDNGNTWEMLQNGLTSPVIYSLAIDPEAYLIAGTSSGLLRSVSPVVTSLPGLIQLHQNFPNPFNSSTTIGFFLPRASYVTLKVFDLLGKEIALLVAEETKFGEHTIRWNAAAVPSGVYFYRLSAVKFSQTNKMILVK